VTSTEQAGVVELRALGERLDDLEDAAISLIDRGGAEAVAGLLAEVRSVRTALGLRERAIEELLVDIMLEDTMTVTGIGTFRLRHGRDRKGWDSEELLSTVIRRSLDPEGTGELPATIPEVVERIRTGVFAAAPITPSMQWRVTALRDQGIDPDEWCTSTPGRTTVQITGADS
jgi:hypothetical protein